MADAAVDPRTQAPPPLLLFVHIPKTAGTTLTMVLSMNEPGPRTRHGGNVFKGGGGIKHGVSFESLLSNADGELDRARILAGHFPLGIRECEYIPEDREVRYITVLREPADRTLSHFFRIRELRGGVEEPNKLDLPPLPAEATVQEALGRGYLHDNLQTRMLSGLAEPFGDVGEEMLERAKHNLRELAFFGLTERFDESLVLAKGRLGLRSILYARPAGDGSDRSGGRSTRRVNTARPRGEEVPREFVEAAEACNRYDIELYRYAEELFDGAPEREELEFEVELGALRAAQADGGVELEAPVPASYGGDEEAWRMLLEARAELLRNEHELAEIRALTYELGQREPEVLKRLGRMQARRRLRIGGDAETARDEIRMLARAQARVFDGESPGPSAGGPRKARSRQPPAPGAGRRAKSGRRRRKRRASGPPDGE